MSPRGKANRRSSIRRQERGPRHSRGGARRLKWLALFALVAVCASLAALAAFLVLRPGSSERSGPPRAAIVDQVSLTDPNSAFVQEATSMLEGAGYAVDYYPGEQVTIDFYQDLPSHHYEVVILRVHSARFQTDAGVLTDDVVLFTGESYDRQRYVAERKAGILARVRYFETNPTSYFFGVTAKFVESRMKGDFKGATVILMGCDGLRSNTMAEAFVRKGAGAFISWDDLVSTDHTDAATERLLQHLVVDKLGTQEAVTRTMTEIGPDPSYGSKLHVYPAEASASAAH
jgi:hypothetical protein